MSNVLLWCLIGGILFVLITFIIILFILKNKTKSSENRTFSELLEALGGIDNIYDITLNGSRISLGFNDKKILNRANIKANGVETIVISNKKITLVVGKTAPQIYRYLTSCIK